jgi:uncharacterized membrane protein
VIREHLFQKRAAADPYFRWRGGDISRVEGFSDGVFALTLTLLVVAGATPTTFFELFELVRDLPVFIVSFAMIAFAWHYHYLFFRRYGLEDGLTLTLNALFLFQIVFFAYPLRFLATFLWHLSLGQPTEFMFAIPEGVAWEHDELFQRMWMMSFYGAGVMGVFGVLALMTWRALRLKAELELDELEMFLSRTSLMHFLIPTVVALVSLIVVWTLRNPGLGGVVYFALGPLHFVLGMAGRAQAKRLIQNLQMVGERGVEPPRP